MSTFVVLGAGAWGFALADLVGRAGHQVTLWGRNPDRLAQLAKTRVLSDRLAGCRLHDSVRVTARLDDSAAADALLFAIPTQALRAFFEAAPPMPRAAAWVNGAKGIEQKTLMTAGEVLAERAGPVAVFTLSGPSHAEELMRQLPTSLVLAGPEGELRSDLQAGLSTDFCRVYASSDRRSVELAGALKNVVALAAGICDGLGFGDNTRGAVITRGLAEITRLGQKLGGRWETFAGLAGMGDLITTCCSPHSRNRKVGIELGKGRALPDILASMTEVAEGVTTTPAARELGARHHLEMPITEQVHAVLYDGEDPQRAARALMTRALKEEATTYAV